MKYLLFMLISFNLLASVPLYKVSDSVKVVATCTKTNEIGTIIRLWTGDSPAYMVEFSDGIEILLDETEITSNP